MSNYKEILNHALLIMDKNPSFILGGSVALILQGALPERNVNDIDFSVKTNSPISDVDAISYSLNKCGKSTDYPQGVDDDYVCFKIQSDAICPLTAYYNLFIRNDVDFNLLNIGGKSYKVQSSDEIFEYKKKWNRGKDRKDIQERIK